jgi:threonyl-tRNA synthetase
MGTKDLEQYRHSLAHLLAAAVLRLYPDTKNTIGPATDNGFYYDFEFAQPITDKDLVKIEKKMKELISSFSSFDEKKVSEDDAKKFFEENIYKQELILEIVNRGEELTLYTSGQFTDLCRGGHADNLSATDPESFKLSHIAGAYWRGDEKNKMLTRIYGLAFATKEELIEYEKMVEEAKKRDHRKLGAELGLFAFSPLVGPGLPLFTPKGTLMRRLLEEFVWSLTEPHGYERVWIPHLAKADLYKTSGHYDKFADDIFWVKSQKIDDDFVLKPMNCPHHAQLYASSPKSYRDLPVRYSEVTTVYRDENTGQLAGLTRVRSITQDDGHIFATTEQVKEEVKNIYDVITKFYQAFNMPLSIRLSLHDPAQKEKYLGSSELWQKSEDSLREILEELGEKYEESVGEAAFYGPKMDFIATDAIGRKWQLATAQLDFNQPERFELEYTASDGTKQRPVMIHRAILGSIERFLGIAIEHYAGAFPVWLSPVQVAILPVGKSHLDYAEKVLAELKSGAIRAELKGGDETLGKRIRNTKMEKVPYILVVGDKEVEAGNVSVESRDRGQLGTEALSIFIEKIKEKINNRK